MNVATSRIGAPKNFLILTAKFGLILAWAVLIVALMTGPLPALESAEKGFTVLDKIVHIFLFGVLVWLMLIFWRECCGRLSRLAYVAAVLLSLAYALGVEYLQQFVATRNSSIYDLVFGLSGMLLAAILFYYSCHALYGINSGGNPDPCFLKHGAKKHKPKLLLHLCCGPCGAQISADLHKDYDVTLLFSNANIDTKQEYKKRLAAVKILAKHHNLPLLVESYNHDEWLALVRGWEEEPERGKRCLLCYRYRLAQTVDKCRELGFDYYASSLSVSPYKDAQAVISIGRALSLGSLPLTQGRVREGSDTNFKNPKFLDKNFNASDGFDRSVAAAKRLGLYRQKYCGCEFSRRDKK